MIPLLDISQLTVDVLDDGQAARVLDLLDLQISPGEIVALLGPSGSGKTTLANLILGITPQGLYRVSGGKMVLRTEGRVWDLLQPEEDQPAGKWIGAIFQEPGAALNPVRRVGDQLNELCGDAAQFETIEQLLRDLDLNPEEVLSRYPWQLSGGQQQRILLALALWPRPVLLLADEPTAALDRHRQEAFLQLLKNLRTRQPELAVLFITHDRHLARFIADRTLIMTDGRLLPYAPPSDKKQPTQANSEATNRPSAQPLLSIEVLQAGYEPGKPILWDVSATLLPGQLLGIAGPSGSGKSSLLRAILGLLPWQDGRVTIHGEEADPESRRSACQLIYQDPGRSFNPRMSMGQAFEEVLRAHPETAPGQVAAWLQQLDLPTDSLDRYPHMFSGGQKQRLAILRALLASPVVLLCDEPFSALDEALQDGFMQLIRELADRLGLGIIVVAHDLPRLCAWCDDLLVLDDGRPYWQGKAADLDEGG